MDYIVNPMLIYLINVLGNIKFLMGMAMFIIIGWLLIGVIRISAQYSYLRDYIHSNSRKDEYMKEADDSRKELKKPIIALIIIVAIGVFIPSKETIIGMIVAEKVTVQNITIARQEIINMVSDIKMAIDGNTIATGDNVKNVR